MKLISSKATLWSAWILLSLLLAGYLGYQMVEAKQKPDFLIGEASHGHYQIEMACESCHTDPFGGKELIHDACLNCHQEELAAVDDSHPIKKFTDPRNADRVAILDARNCVTCHNEHQLEQTRAMGVTLADDFCFRCHQEIAEDRPSHQGMEFDSCASAGCHNYHDNKALYEDFLLKHQDEVATNTAATLPESTLSKRLPRKLALALSDANGETVDLKINRAWAASDHASAGVNCTDCHQPDNAKSWQQNPGLEACESCHKDENKGFLAGKHGMRLAAELPAISPAQARLDFHQEADDHQLNCNSCHDPHQPDLQQAAVESCLNCHDDQHSRQYKDSPHAQLWQKELAGESTAATGVSCASCHMPREQKKIAGEVQVMVQHNQNLNLRPNEKMIRSVCMNCHSLAFSIDALADPKLVSNNFNGKPGKHIASIEMAVDREHKK
ncbi:MAG: cytochrome c3 family protein [Motiliproteus sp.]|nr:cytochrome c3 family protein [Motiliproteus sp.]MCW9052464.1 cytochrome c3 family protein [Motiliproteus sp.]